MLAHCSGFEYLLGMWRNVLLGVMRSLVWVGASGTVDALVVWFAGLEWMFLDFSPAECPTMA